LEEVSKIHDEECREQYIALVTWEEDKNDKQADCVEWQDTQSALPVEIVIVTRIRASFNEERGD
jgi:hypothetical protein